LSSSIFATDMREVEYFLSDADSDCGIANVNMGTSGVEIAGPSAAKRRRRSARAGRMRGAAICAARPVPSMTGGRSRWHRA
jgi:aldehyde dehydrogenase (NAD+)